MAATKAIHDGLIDKMKNSEMDLEIIRLALSEDLGNTGDVTSLACVPPERQSAAKVIVKQPGVIAGIGCFSAVFHEVDPSVIIEVIKNDGSKVAPGDIVVTVRGSSRSILSAERTSLNFLGHLSGVATETAKLAALIEGTGVTLLDTRKTMPGLRIAEKAAVVSGGGANHRIGLFDMMLIKENHIAAAGGIRQALEGAHRFNAENNSALKIEIEVTSIEELKEALRYNPDRIMLDNFEPAGVRQAVEIAGWRVELEVSGGVTGENIRRFAETGPDFISVGKITASAPVLDLSMIIEESQ